MDIDIPEVPEEMTENEKEYLELADAVVTDANAELDNLKILQKIVKSQSLDDCINSAVEKQRQQIEAHEKHKKHSSRASSYGRIYNARRYKQTGNAFTMHKAKGQVVAILDKI